MIFWGTPHNLRRFAVLWLLAAVALRLAVPAGYMPAGGTLVLCTGAGAVTVTVDRDGHPTKPADSDHSVCAFAAMSAVGPLPDSAPLALPAVVAAAAALVAVQLRLGEGLGRPPRPSTGPPLPR